MLVRADLQTELPPVGMTDEQLTTLILSAFGQRKEPTEPELWAGELAD